MIEFFEKELKNNTNKKLGFVNQKLSFLKYSTAISGNGLGNKVLFFVFAENDKAPSAVIKSVRSLGDTFAINQGHHNLKLLNNLTHNSSFHTTFPTALFLYNDENQIFCAETICLGRKANLNEDLEKILDKYIAFSKFLSKQQPNEIRIDFSYGEKIINELSGPKIVLDELLKYLGGLWGEQVVILPRVHQHGDLTIDNVLIDTDEVRFIDCDTFGIINLVGFDVFHLATKGGLTGWKDILGSYFKEMDIKYIPDKKLLFLYFLHELHIKRDYILKNKDSSAVIMEFETML